jgi:hypothetical protein
MSRYWLPLCAALSLLALAPATAQAETLTDASVVGLVRAGLSPEAIVAKIRISGADYDLSSDQLVALKRAGVPDAVISAMLETAAGDAGPRGGGLDNTSADPAAPHAPGGYLLESGPARMQAIQPISPADIRVTNVLASVFTSGIVPLKQTTVLQGPQARVGADTSRPVFYFYFDQANQDAAGTPFVNAWHPSAVNSPSDLTLVRFHADGQGNRSQVVELRVFGPRGAGDDANIAFNSQMLAPGVFRVTPSADLPPGEYGFTYGIQVAEDDTETRVFDFSVAP